MNDVTQILQRIERGDAIASEDLLPLVYDELRRLAAKRLKHESSGQSIQATALVHDAYLRLVDSREQQGWESRGHFFAAAAESMRRILVENARRKKRIKHGGDLNRVELDDVELLTEEPCEDLVALDEALRKLEAEDPRKAELVKLRFFAGLTMPEIALAMKISLATAERDWTYARTWLYAEMNENNF